MTRLTALGALLAALVASTFSPAGAAPAVAAPDQAPRAGIGLGITSDALDVVMTNDGAAHVAYLTQVSSGQPYVVHVCRIPAGGTTCTETASKTLPNSDDTVGPWIVSDGTKVVVAVGNHDGAEERTYASLATDSVTFGALSKVADVTPTDVELDPDGRPAVDHGVARSERPGQRLRVPRLRHRPDARQPDGRGGGVRVHSWRHERRWSGARHRTGRQAGRLRGRQHPRLPERDLLPHLPRHAEQHQPHRREPSGGR